MSKEKYVGSVKPGMVFGELTVIDEDFEAEKKHAERLPHDSARYYYLCQCSCGKKTTVGLYNLVHGTTQSCGHLQVLRTKEGTLKNVKDMTGMKIGDLVVIEKDTTTQRGSGKSAKWICECTLCGNRKSIRGSELRSGKVVDCGCQKRKRLSDAKLIDISGKVFGYLTVLGRDLSVGYKSGQHARWLCRCELCGRTESVTSKMLLKYGKDRCRPCCGMTLGEKRIMEILDENNISYIHDKPYSDCKNPDTGAVLRFDFRITNNSECDYIIEFDGEQHFKDVNMWGSSDTLKDRLWRDTVKNTWCAERGIPIIRIPYTRLKKLCIEDLLLDSTPYLAA